MNSGCCTHAERFSCHPRAKRGILVFAALAWPEPAILIARQASRVAGVLSITMQAMMIHQTTSTGAVAVVPHPTAL